MSDDQIVVASASRNTRAKTKPPSPSVMITRNSKTPTAAPSSTALLVKVSKVLLSKIKLASKQVKFLEKQGVRVVEEIPSVGSNFICVTHAGELGTTAKLLRSLALGKAIVTDEWVTQSKAAGYLLPTTNFIHEAIAPTMQADRRHLFQSRTLFFTNLLVQQYDDGWPSVEALARDAGASRVEKGTARKGADLTPRRDIIYFGCNEKGDHDAVSLVETEGKVVFGKDMLTQSVLRGVLLDGEEFRLEVGGKGAGKKSGRKG